MVLIADDDGPTSIAGVMGGARSEVTDSTTRVLMEVANWDGANVHQTSLNLGCAARPRAATRRASSRSSAWRPGDRHPAHRRGLRGADGAGHDRRRGRRAAAQDRRAAPCAGDAPARRRGPAGAQRGDPHRAGIQAHVRPRRSRRRRAGLPRSDVTREAADREVARLGALEVCRRRCPRATAPRGG